MTNRTDKTTDCFPDDCASGDHVKGDHVTSDGMSGGQVIGDGMSDDHVTGDGMSDSHVTGDGMSGGHVIGDGMSGDHVIGDGMSGGHVIDDGMSDSRLARQVAFLLEADKSKNIFRQTYIADASRKENDAEHGWHLGLMALLLSEYAPQEVDREKLLSMVLVHDLVEIYAGDTYAFDTEGAATKEARERESADKLFGLLPEDQAGHLRGLWEEFEREETPEARFAKALDRLQPLLLNISTEGRSWREHGIRLSQVLKRNQKTPEEFPALWNYIQDGIQDCVANGSLIDDTNLHR